MKLLKLNFSLLVLLFALTSCDKDEDKLPIISGSSVTVTNTFTSDAFTGGTETAIEDLFMVDAGSLAATATVIDGVEFPAYLLNLYDIDIDQTSITFTVVAQDGDPTYGDLFRVLEAGTTDRYYLTFAEDQNVNSSSSNNSSVNLRIDSDRVLVVEVGEGFDFKPNASFSISLRH